MSSKETKQLTFIVAGIILMILVGNLDIFLQRILGIAAAGWVFYDLSKVLFKE